MQSKFPLNCFILLDYLQQTKGDFILISIFFFSWVENMKVALRLIKITDNLKQVMKFWESLPKSKQPKCKSFTVLKEALSDPFLKAKLHFFHTLLIFLSLILKSSGLINRWSHLCIVNLKVLFRTCWSLL